MSLSYISQEVKNLQGLPREIGEFLHEESFSKEEIILLTYFFENQILLSSESFFTENKYKDAIKALLEKK